MPVCDAGMATPQRTMSLLAITLGLYVIVVALVLYSLFQRWHYDDPFITYRYADQLARGAGFVYNPGERVLSTTTPLFALVLAIGRFLSPNIPALANLIGCFSLAIGGVCLWDLGQSWKLPLVGWAGLLLYPIFGVVMVTIGSETPLYLAFCLAAFAFYARRRYTACATCCALAVLTRADGVLVGLVLAADFALRHRASLRWNPRSMIPWRALLVFVIAVAPWFCFSWVYFGEPFPATLAAKRAQGALSISQRFAPGFATILNWYASEWFYRLEILLAAIGLIFAFGRVRQTLVLIAWTAIYFLAYSLLGVSNYFWYYAPLAPGFVVLVALGLTAIQRALQRITRAGSRFDWWPSALVLIVLGSLTLLHFRQAIAIGQQPDARYAIYRAVGEWLQANTPPVSRAGALEVGIIGYYAQRPMIDFAGLIQPDVARALQPASTYDDAALYAVERYAPDFVVLIDGSLPRFNEGFVQRRCSTVQQFDGATHGFGANIRIYECATDGKL